MSTSPNNGRYADHSQWYKITGIGMEFTASIALLGVGGHYMDRWLGTGPWLMLVGGALGFASGLWIMLKAAKKAFHD